MMWLELIAGWFVGSILLALVAGKMLSGMARISGDRGGRATTVRPIRTAPVAPVIARRTAA